MAYDKLVKDLREVEEMLNVAQFKEATNIPADPSKEK